MKFDLAKKLCEVFDPVYCKIYDDSNAHRGHRGTSLTENTHFHVFLVSEIFKGQSLIQRHRAVNASCKSFFDQGLHALKLTVLDENQWENVNGE